jgi:quercetin dioxygenase-like cupin family protein
VLSRATLLFALLSCAATVVAAQDSLRWGPAPSALPPGARMAIVRGDPAKPGPFAVRFRFPDGFTVPPHYHPVDEHVRVIRGQYGHGFGDVIDTTQLHWRHAGDRVTLPALSHHFAKARGATETEVSGVGPFTVTYIGKAPLKASSTPHSPGRSTRPTRAGPNSPPRTSASGSPGASPSTRAADRSGATRLPPRRCA